MKIMSRHPARRQPPALLEEPLAPLPQPVDSPDDAQDVTGIASDLVIVDDIVQVQGRLTDADGAPIDGNRTIVASLYDVATAGVARCFDSDTVAVNNGLFVMNMDSCTASDINGDRLYLGIKVGADNEMTPRQQIFATPYAWALRPGSIIKGADSYVFVPGSSLIKNLSADSTRWDIRANGAARVFRGATAGGQDDLHSDLAAGCALWAECHHRASHGLLSRQQRRQCLYHAHGAECSDRRGQPVEHRRRCDGPHEHDCHLIFLCTDHQQ
jgi:hypothetical protein